MYSSYYLFKEIIKIKTKYIGYIVLIMSNLQMTFLVYEKEEGEEVLDY